MKHEEVSAIKPDGSLYPFQVNDAQLRLSLIHI